MVGAALAPVPLQAGAKVSHRVWIPKVSQAGGRRVSIGKARVAAAQDHSFSAVVALAASFFFFSPYAFQNLNTQEKRKKEKKKKKKKKKNEKVSFGFHGFFFFFRNFFKIFHFLSSSMVIQRIKGCMMMQSGCIKKTMVGIHKSYGHTSLMFYCLSIPIHTIRFPFYIYFILKKIYFWKGKKNVGREL